MAILQDLEDLVAGQFGIAMASTEALARLGVSAASIATLANDAISTKTISTSMVDSDTLFQACSISKPIAAIAVFRAIQAGHLALAAPITRYLSLQQLSFLETPQTKPLLQHITIEMLLSHTSGLSVGGFPGYARDPPPIATILQGLTPSNTPQVHLESFPGQRFRYSGGGITVVQMILETVLQKPFAAIVQELVFKPLNMSRSCYKLSDTEENFAAVHDTAHTAHDPPYHIFPESAAAGLWTTPGELLLAIRALQSSLKGTNDSFLKQEWARRMLTTVQWKVACGWMTPIDSGVFNHSGSNEPGYRCVLLGWADIAGDGKVELGKAEGGGICVMTNSPQGAELVIKIIIAAGYLMGWPAFSPALGLAVSFTPLTAPGEVRADWKEWVGYWGDKWHVLHGERPTLKFAYLPPVRLLPAAMTPRRYEDGKLSIDLVVEGLEVMLRLGWEKGERVMEVWPGQESEMDVLRRTHV
ncbi:hypothetical protein MMC34_004299 [Xylographa carneopallida]|nr:hypothetical protein [Xylographa carneopallida]